jgi:mono/diheme cytochrome c family protein
MDQRSDLKPEMDFRDMVRSPRKLFGYTYIYFLVMFVVIGILYVGRLDAIGRSSILPVALKDSSSFVKEIPLQSPQFLPPVDVKVAIVPTDSILKRGREVFRTTCASCHGDNGMGDGAAGLVLNPRPRNFHVATGWTNGARISDIYRTLQEGIVRNGMASYSYLPPADRFALIHVIRSFHPAPPADAEQDIAALEALYQLSKGTTIAAQVPIAKATKLMVAEKKAGLDAVKRAVATLADASTPGAVLFMHETADPERAVRTVRANAARMTTVEEFIRIISADPGALGFRTSVARLSRENWAAMHQAVMQGVQ